MAASMPRISLGKSKNLPPGGEGVRTSLSDIRHPTGQPTSLNLGSGYTIDLTNLDQVCRLAFKMKNERPLDMVPFFEHAELVAAQNRVSARPIEVMGTPISIFPSQESFLVKKMREISMQLMRGLIDGIRDSFKNNPTALNQLGTRLVQASIVNVVFPPIFLAGVGVGLIGDVIKTIKGIYGLITNFDQIVKSTKDLLTAILEDSEAAYEFGKLVGQELSKKIIALSKKGPIRFAFEIGRLIGPIIVYTVLSFTGVGAYAVGTRLLKDLITILSKFPRLKRLLDGILHLVAKGKGKIKALKHSVSARIGSRKSGMTLEHVHHASKVAASENRIIAVRFTNKASTEKIRLGYPGKRLSVKIKTNKETGIATVTDSTPLAYKKMALNDGYYIVDNTGVARNRMGDILDLPKNKDWPRRGQVIDPKSKKPLVGDYDLHSVIKPSNTGQNIVGKSGVRGGQSRVNLPDATNTDVQRVVRLLNDGMDQPRFLHGALDGYGNLASAGPGTIVFHPDGSIQVFNTVKQMEKFFEEIRRVPITGQYPRAPLPDMVPENVVVLFPKN